VESGQEASETVGKIMAVLFLLAPAVYLGWTAQSQPPDATRPSSTSVSHYYTPTPTAEEYCHGNPQWVDEYTGRSCEDDYREARDQADYEEDQAAQAGLDDEREWEEDEIYRGGPLD
jgi:hypothetical protein